MHLSTWIAAALRLLLLRIATAMTVRELGRTVEDFAPTPAMPVRAAVPRARQPDERHREQPVHRGWKAMGKGLPKPSAILCISAHWETRGTFVTSMEKPRTIHDFGVGFPQPLFGGAIPRPGSTALVRSTLTRTHIQEDHSWGLDRLLGR